MITRLRLALALCLLKLWELFWLLLFGEPDDCTCARCELRRMTRSGASPVSPPEPPQ